VQRLNGPNSVRIISVIEVKAKRGLGIEEDPVREITQYWDLEGNLLTEIDPYPYVADDETYYQ
jgi:hypothetical protein